MALRANFYIDGFNLYYGCLKRTPYRWLDLGTFCRILLPGHLELGDIKYFTARIISRAENLQAPQRQQTYLRALATVPGLSVHFGHFLTANKSMPLAYPKPGGSKFALVVRTDEKGSDVNLASHLLCDSFEKRCQAAVVMSNDSDLLLPIRMAQERYHVEVHVVCPHKHPSNILRQHARTFRGIREAALRSSLFPDVLEDSNGAIRKPAGW